MSYLSEQFKQKEKNIKLSLTLQDGILTVTGRKRRNANCYDLKVRLETQIDYDKHHEQYRAIATAVRQLTLLLRTPVNLQITSILTPEYKRVYSIKEIES